MITQDGIEIKKTGVDVIPRCSTLTSVFFKCRLTYFLFENYGIILSYDFISAETQLFFSLRFFFNTGWEARLELYFAWSREKKLLKM